MDNEIDLAKLGTKLPHSPSGLLIFILIFYYNIPILIIDFELRIKVF